MFLTIVFTLMALHLSFIIIKEKKDYSIPFIMLVVLILFMAGAMTEVPKAVLTIGFGVLYFISAFLYDRPIAILTGCIVFSSGIAEMVY